MASTASALSLSQFQPITAATISLGCILAYNAEIPSCSINDFVAGKMCSAPCIRGLERIESRLEGVCNSADVPEISVLGQALLGNLVELLCPGTAPETPIASSSPSSRSPTSTIITPPRTSSRAPLTFTTVRPPSATETETEEPEVLSTPTSSASPTTLPDAPPPTFIQSSPPTSISSSSSATTTAPPPADDRRGSTGGGSPFDIVRSDSTQLTACWTKAVAVGLGVGLLLLR
ncbi:hypothetical protein C8A01DRAFT_42597 [Parachaetomium inaequale]|uniref:Uncharacterized protein n=1 Tax=Parachaetomium inaequale TaxID=2588326 RepID=A0AAN6SWI9_9PEZI|nr:hypothetical protein C8A01DRAFT_42597 [Parachaetomium inaequale]